MTDFNRKRPCCSTARSLLFLFRMLLAVTLAVVFREFREFKEFWEDTLISLNSLSSGFARAYVIFAVFFGIALGFHYIYLRFA